MTAAAALPVDARDESTSRKISRGSNQVSAQHGGGTRSDRADTAGDGFPPVWGTLGTRVPGSGRPSTRRLEPWCILLCYLRI